MNTVILVGRVCNSSKRVQRGRGSLMPVAILYADRRF